MPYFPQPQAGRRAERVGLSESTPVVLRFPDGRRFTGNLQLVSVTGGLLCVPRPLEPGSVVKMMFLTRRGPVLGSAEMLGPLSWDKQPFRFVTLYDDDHSRLRAAIQSRLEQTRRDDQQKSRERGQVENFRAW
jgi:hypothetical protein